MSTYSRFWFVCGEDVYAQSVGRLTVLPAVADGHCAWWGKEGLPRQPPSVLLSNRGLYVPACIIIKRRCS
jgi:hypothetical protein